MSGEPGRGSAQRPACQGPAQVESAATGSKRRMMSTRRFQGIPVALLGGKSRCLKSLNILNDLKVAETENCKSSYEKTTTNFFTLPLIPVRCRN